MLFSTKYAGTVVDDSSAGSRTWNNPTNAQGEPDGTNFATVTAATLTTHYLKCTNYGFNIPANAKIRGFIVSPSYYAILGTGVAGADNTGPRLVRGGVIESGASNNRNSTAAMPTAMTVVPHGSEKDMWSSRWRPSEINDSGFGVALRQIAAGGTVGYSCDAVAITVYYTLPKLPSVWIRRPQQPYGRIQALKAFDIHRAFMHMEPSQATFSVARNDPALTSGVLTPGNIVEINGDSVPWFGILKPSEEDISGSDIKYIAEDFISHLGERNVPDMKISGISSGRAVEDLFNIADRSNPMVCRIAPGVSIETGFGLTTDISASSLLDAIKQVSDSSLYEYGFYYTSDPARLDAVFRWSRRIGSDKRKILITNTHFVDAKVTIDPKGTPTQVRVIGSDPAIISERTVFSSPLLSNGVPVSPIVRSPQSYNAGSSIGQTIYDMRMNTILGSGRKAEQELVSPRYGREHISGKLNNKLDWASIEVGDTVTLRLGGVRLGDDMVRSVKITGLQPDEVSGEMDFVAEVTDDYAA